MIERPPVEALQRIAFARENLAGRYLKVLPDEVEELCDYTLALEKNFKYNYEVLEKALYLACGELEGNVESIKSIFMDLAKKELGYQRCEELKCEDYDETSVICTKCEYPNKITCGRTIAQD